MNLTQWEFVFPLSLDELSRDVSVLSPPLEGGVLQWLVIGQNFRGENKYVKNSKKIS